MVLVIMALLVILVTIVLSLALMNYRMKTTSRESLVNFYDAESAMDEIRAGLTEAVSVAATDAYSTTMEEFAILDESARKSRFTNQYIRNLKTELGIVEAEGTATYSRSYIDGLIKETAYIDEAKWGAKFETDEGENIVNETENGLVLKNITVVFYGEQNYVSEIKTDIVLGVPEINFSQMATMPNLLGYAIVAQDSVQISEGAICNVSGNAYVGTGESVINNAQLNVNRTAGAVESQLFISGGTIKGIANSTLNVQNMEMWSNDIVVDSSSAFIEDTSLYVKDDLVLTNSLYSAMGAHTDSETIISGTYCGFGNVETATRASAVIGDEALREEIENNPANYNSSIVINGVNSSLDISDLDVFKLAGNAYVNGTEHVDALSTIGEGLPSDITSDMNIEDVQMGESLSIRTDQIAWFVPADCVAPAMDNGGVNPMPITRYSELLNEIEEEYNQGQADFDAKDYIVSYDVSSEKLGGRTLEELGVTGYQLEAQQVVGTSKSMVYLFLKFDSIESANAFFRTYYSQQANATKLREYLDLYASSGILLPDEVLQQSGDTNFFFNGNVLASEASQLYVADTLSGISATAGESRRQEMLNEGIAYQNNYSALNAKLLKEYSELLEEERGKTVYDNLVNSMISATDADYTIAEGDREVFVGTEGQSAIVVNGDFTLNDTEVSALRTTADAGGAVHPGAEYHVIIASGDVTVEKNFNGLIIAGGKIYVNGGRNVTVTADAQKASLALMAKNDTEIYAYEYLKNGLTYTISGSEDSSQLVAYSADSLNMTDYVLYANWSKQ